MFYYYTTTLVTESDRMAPVFCSSSRKVSSFEFVDRSLVAPSTPMAYRFHRKLLILMGCGWRDTHVPSVNFSEKAIMAVHKRSQHVWVGKSPLVPHHLWIQKRTNSKKEKTFAQFRTHLPRAEQFFGCQEARAGGSSGHFFHGKNTPEVLQLQWRTPSLTKCDGATKKSLLTLSTSKMMLKKSCWWATTHRFS